MKTTVQRLLENAEESYLSIDNSTQEGTCLILQFPEICRDLLTHTATDFSEEFSQDGEITIHESNVHNMYNIDLTIGEVSYSIGQVLIHQKRLDEILSLTSMDKINVALFCRENVGVSIDDLGTELNSKINLPAIQIIATGNYLVV